MGNTIKTNSLLSNPGFWKGASRVADMYGKLDEYNYQNDSDYDAIKNDWVNVGQNILISVHKNVKRKK